MKITALFESSAYDVVLRQVEDGISMYIAPWGDSDHQITGVERIRVADVGDLAQQLIRQAAQELHIRLLNIRTVKGIDREGNEFTLGPKDAEYLEDRVEMAYDRLKTSE